MKRQPRPLTLHKRYSFHATLAERLQNKRRHHAQIVIVIPTRMTNAADQGNKKTLLYGDGLRISSFTPFGYPLVPHYYPLWRTSIPQVVSPSTTPNLKRLCDLSGPELSLGPNTPERSKLQSCMQRGSQQPQIEEKTLSKRPRFDFACGGWPSGGMSSSTSSSLKSCCHQVPSSKDCSQCFGLSVKALPKKARLQIIQRLSSSGIN